MSSCVWLTLVVEVERWISRSLSELSAPSVVKEVVKRRCDVSQGLKGGLEGADQQSLSRCMTWIGMDSFRMENCI